MNANIPSEESLDAAYLFVELMRPRADDQFNIMWYGWALREAFLAGATWQELRTRDYSKGKPE